MTWRTHSRRNKRINHLVPQLCCSHLHCVCSGSLTQTHSSHSHVPLLVPPIKPPTPTPPAPLSMATGNAMAMMSPCHIKKRNVTSSVPAPNSTGKSLSHSGFSLNFPFYFTDKVWITIKSQRKEKGNKRQKQKLKRFCYGARRFSSYESSSRV